MDLKFQSSFIPKQPIVPQTDNTGSHVSIFSLIATLAFILAVGLVGAVLIAENVLNRSLESLDAQIVEAQNSFELPTIENLQIAERRLEIARKLLEDHRSFSQFLELLSQSTFNKISFSALNYSQTNEGGNQVTLVGTATDLNALSVQANLFRSIPGVDEVLFHDFALDEDGVGFTADFFLAPNIVLYKNYLTK